MAEEKQVLMYKGRPLMRVDNLIYYGSMADSHIVMQLTDPAAKSRDRVVKKGEKAGLYSALDFGSVWLDRALAGK